MMRMKKILMAVAALTMPTLAMAHPGHGGGLLDGLTHPLTGWDHLLAMVAIGMLAAQMKGRALWALPAAFVAALAVGGVMGLAEVTVGPVEAVIAASLVVMGSLLALRKALPLKAGIAMALLFGLYHGFAHGLEAGTAPGTFMLGMVLASAMLHVAGIAMMRFGQQVWAARLARVAGVGMALAGGTLLLG